MGGALPQAFVSVSRLAFASQLQADKSAVLVGVRGELGIAEVARQRRRLPDPMGNRGRQDVLFRTGKEEKSKSPLDDGDLETWEARREANKIWVKAAAHQQHVLKSTVHQQCSLCSLTGKPREFQKSFSISNLSTS